jgi:hypothetical protein
MRNSLLVISLLLSLAVVAQTEQKAMMAGGNFDIGYSFQDSIRIFTINLQPRWGIFVYKNLLLGASVGIGLTSDNRARNRGNRLILNTTFTPFVRYFFLKEKMRPFIYAFGGYMGSTSLIRGNSGNVDGATYGGGFGFDYFVNKNVAVEATLGYVGAKFAERSLNSRVSFGVGFQYFFMPKIFKNSTLAE